MAKLIYMALASLDGFIADEEGGFSWAEPDHEVHAFVNDLARPIGIHLYGRGMYEVMVAWEDPALVADAPEEMKDFAEVWRAAEKIVYSTTLDEVRSARTRLEREFDAAAVREMKANADADLSVSGPGLAASAFRAGLVDECHLFLNPVVVGAGKRALPSDVRLDLELMDERRFAGGTVFLRYGTA